MADLVGFTDALGRPPTPSRSNASSTAVSSGSSPTSSTFGGRLDKIVGDEIIALFGAPVAHEDDAERAVRAALRMHETLAERRRGDRDPRADAGRREHAARCSSGAMRAGGDPTAMGDVVNTAQRLEKLGEPGEVIVGPGAPSRDPRRDPLRVARPASAAGPRRAGRGVPRDRRARAARPAPRRASRRRSSAATPSSRRCGSVVHDGDARASRAQLVLLVGDAGVGKSRLASELGDVARVRARRERAHRRSASPTATPTRSARSPRRCASAASRADAARRARAVARPSATLGSHSDRPRASAPNRAGRDRAHGRGAAVPHGRRSPGPASTRPARATKRCAPRSRSSRRSRANAPLVLVLSGPALGERRQRSSCATACSRGCATVRSCSSRPPGPASTQRWTPEPGKHNELALHLDPLDADATARARARAVRRRRRRRDRRRSCSNAAAATRSSSKSSSRSCRRRGDSDRAATSCRPRCTVSSRPGSTRSDPAERSLLEDCAVVGASGPIAAVLALADRADARRLLDGLAERDLLEHRRRRLPLQVGADPRDRVRHAHQGRTRPPPRASSRRCSKRAASSAIDQAAHHLATAAELVDELGTVAGVPSDIREQAIAALDARPSARRVGRVVAPVRTPPRPRARVCSDRRTPRRWRPRCSDGRGHACTSARSTTRRDDALDRARPRRARRATSAARRPR